MTDQLSPDVLRNLAGSPTRLEMYQYIMQITTILTKTTNAVELVTQGETQEAAVTIAEAEERFKRLRELFENIPGFGHVGK